MATMRDFEIIHDEVNMEQYLYNELISSRTIMIIIDAQD
jgi:hypothetical protein